MTLVFLTLVIGVLNVGLGYALAVYLGYGPPGLLEAWRGLIAGEWAAEQPLKQLMSMPLEQMLDDEPDEEMDVEMYDDMEGQSDEEDAPELLAPEATQNWDLNEKYIETSILKLNIAMIKSGVKATELDTRLRACRGRTDLATIRKCLRELKEDCETYLDEQAEAADRFRERIGELGELSVLGEETEMANLEQAAQIETTLSSLEKMDFESDLELGNRRLLGELSNLREARHKLRDYQDVAFLAIARYHNRMDRIEKRLYNDPLTKLYNRIGTEATLWQWWEQGRHKSREMNAALFDLDHFGRINEVHGSLIGDRILCQLAGFIRKQVGKTDLVGRFAGQRFLVVMLNIGPRTATKNAETIRQSIEKITFMKGQQEIYVTVCGGLTEVSPQDTWQALFQRLEEALREAKKTGPNRSFFHNGEEPEAIDSPNFGAQDVAVEI